jgi:hypothetical protein
MKDVLKSIYNSVLMKGPRNQDNYNHKPQSEVKNKKPKKTQKDYLPDWKKLVRQDSDLWQNRISDANANNHNVLIANNVAGFYNITVVESLLAVALSLRKAKVHILLCDGILPACLKLKVAKTKPSKVAKQQFRDNICKTCMHMGKTFEIEGIKVHRFSEYLCSEDLSKIKDVVNNIELSDIPMYVADGLALGEHAHAGCLRYYSRGDLVGQQLSGQILKCYLEASIMTSVVTERIIKKNKISAACFHHGIYIPQGVVGEVCRKNQVHVSNWNVAYRKKCFIFSHKDTYHHTLLEEPVELWKNMAFNDNHDEKISRYLKSRWGGSQDWIYFHETPDDSDELLVRETGIDLKKPIVGLLTNVIWDAQLHYRANAFPSMLDWIFLTIEYFSKRKDIQLLIRIHPAELRGTQISRQFVAKEVSERFPNLAENIFMIGPESNINTYAAMTKCNSVIIYGTKTGVELTSMGIPVIVAGEAWIRNKSLTIDVSNQKEYIKVLDSLPLDSQRLTDEDQREARKYAYHFFMRRMIPINAIVPTEGAVPFVVNIDSIKELDKGVDRGLDVICEGILTQSDFIYPMELIQ